MDLSTTERTRLTRLAERGRTERGDLYAVLDAGLVGHLGLVRDGVPVVLPLGYGRIDDTVYLHGSTGAGWGRELAGPPVCLTVTQLDGVVYARSAFNHSLNYRSAVVLGVARLVDDPEEKLLGLRSLTDRLAPGSWSYARRPSRRELAATAVLALNLAEASVKVRTGPPHDEPEDVAAGGRWAGVVPIRLAFGPPEPAPDLEVDGPPPDHVLARATGPGSDRASADSVYAAAGGLDGLRRLAEAWHERVMADEVVAHAFGHGFRADHSERLAGYWAEALGGPASYSERYGDETEVVRIHSGNGPHEEMDRRAIDCFDQALADVGLVEPVAGVLHDYFAWATTTTMARYHDSADDVPPGLSIPHWSWDGLVSG